MDLGFIEMLARQMTGDLQSERDNIPAGGRGISFGTLIHNIDGTWNVSKVERLVAPSLATKGTTPPSLIIRPFHQASNIVPLR